MPRKVNAPLKRFLLSLRVACAGLLLPIAALTGCVSSANPVTSNSDTPVSIQTSSLPLVEAGLEVDTTLQAAGGVAPYHFSFYGGALPAGLSLGSNGTISGAPTSAGAYDLVVQVTDSGSPETSATHSYVGSIAAPLTVPTGALASAEVTFPYSAGLITGGVPPYTLSLTNGALPQGMALSGGAISGVPTVAQTNSFGIEASDAAGQTITSSLSLTVKPTPVLANPSASESMVIGTAFAQTVTASGGTLPYAFAVESGNLPGGLSLAANGVISGTPTDGGNFAPTIQITDSSVPAQTTETTLNLEVFDTLVSVNATAAGVTVPSTGFGMHTSLYDSSLSDTTALPALLATTGIKVLRYPGGSYSDNYHWAQYTMTPIFASTTTACGNASNGYLAPHTDFGSFLQTLEATGTQAMITVNYGSSLADAAGTKSTGEYAAGTCSEPNAGGQPQEAAAWVAYANGDPANTQVIGVDAVGFDWKTVGFWAGIRAALPLATDDGYNFLRLGMTAPVGIKYWEIGNEVYYNGYNSNNNSESDNHAPYVYPQGFSGDFDSREGERALSPTAYGTNAAAYIAAMRAVDPTIKLGVVVSSAIDPIPSTWTPAVLNAVCGTTTFDFAILHYYPGTYNATTAAQLLLSPESDMPNLVSNVKADVAAACPTSASAVQIFVTETNPDGKLDPAVPAAVPGLYAAHELLTALETGVSNVEWLELHAGAGTFLAPGTETPGPAFYGIELAHNLANVGDRLLPVSSTVANLLVHAAQQQNGTTGVLLINADPAHTATVKVAVSGNALGSTATEYSFGVGTTQNGTKLDEHSLAINGQTFAVNVPPFTAVEVLIP